LKVIRIHSAVIALAVFSVAAQAQPARRAFIQSVGQASVSIKPDQAQIQFAALTTATTAQAAANQNAIQVTAVLTALGAVLGPNPDIKTLSYSLNPNYTYPQNGQPILTGYTASNTIQVTLIDLSIIGKVIDTGIQAGADRVQGLQFGVQDDQPVRQQALKMATAQAKAHADAMASGLGLHTGPAISIQEGAGVTILPANRTPGAAGATTPIETGVVSVDATVTLQVELTQ
jgi:uncharacterized protein YggE